MRTTLNLDDDVLAAARILADEKGTSLGVAVSELARRGRLGPELPVPNAGCLARWRPIWPAFGGGAVPNAGCLARWRPNWPAFGGGAVPNAGCLARWRPIWPAFGGARGPSGGVPAA